MVTYQALISTQRLQLLLLSSVQYQFRYVFQIDGYCQSFWEITTLFGSFLKIILMKICYYIYLFQMAVLYFFAQLIGALLGYRCLQALTPSKVLAQSSGSSGFCQTAPHEDVNDIEAFILEYISTMVLISLCCGVWDQRNSKHQDSVPLKFGLAICLLSIIFVSFRILFGMGNIICCLNVFFMAV